VRNTSSIVELEDDALQVQQEVDNVFTQPVNGGVFMYHAGDLNFGRGIADHR
jgi:hypothetical protein